MFSVCMVMGIAPVVPKRKEQYEIEVTIKETGQPEDKNENMTMFRADS